MNFTSDQAVFGPEDEPDVRASSDVSIFSDITKSQLVGLLAALGEWAIRTGPPDLNEGCWGLTKSTDPAVIEAQRALRVCYWSRREARQSALQHELVFDTDERREIALHKYLRGFEDITKRDVVSLLESLIRYVPKAPRQKQIFGPMTGVVRVINAHNALVAFRERRFTIDEFEHGVRQVVRGHERHLRAEWSRHAWRSR